MIKFLADYLVIIIVLIGVSSLLIYVRKDRYQTYLRIIMMGLTALLIAKVLSLVFQPDGARPFLELKQAAKASFLNNPGFPSDHALFVMFITIAVWVATKRKLLSLMLLIMSIGVAVGRVLALVHTPLDVTGGFAVAFIAGLLWYGPELFSSKQSHLHPHS
jgi:membrane-associated phospholipid phosphatase